MKRLGAVACLAGMLLALPGAAFADGPVKVRVTGSVGIGYDDNLGSSQANDEKVDSWFHSGFYTIDALWVPAPWIGFVGRTQVQGDVYHHYDDLSNGRLLGMFRTVIKPGSGFFTPVFTGWISGAYLEYGSAIRDGNERRAGVYVVQNLTTAISAKLEAKGFHRKAEGRVFDQKGKAALAMFTWAPIDHLTLNAGYEYQDGDNSSTAEPNVRILRAAEEIEADDAFGGADRNEFVYRFDAKTQIGYAGFNFRLSHDWAIDGQWQAISVDADFGNHYRRNIGVLGILLKF